MCMCFHMQHVELAQLSYSTVKIPNPNEPVLASLQAAKFHYVVVCTAVHDRIERVDFERGPSGGVVGAWLARLWELIVSSGTVQ